MLLSSCTQTCSDIAVRVILTVMDERVTRAVDAVFATVRTVAAERPRDWQSHDHPTAWVELYEIELLDELRRLLGPRIKREQQDALARGRARDTTLVSWSDVGEALDISRQSAQERLGH